mmetsp:Transcript_4175/g.8480  ORF Transcript_4175/g.8480 Transcript_4175/m.8480 type:complete len:97 (+) Transcript_4175:304-594(+)
MSLLTSFAFVLFSFTAVHTHAVIPTRFPNHHRVPSFTQPTQTKAMAMSCFPPGTIHDHQFKEAKSTTTLPTTLYLTSPPHYHHHHHHWRSYETLPV